jgi:hypothetical protein
VGESVIHEGLPFALEISKENAVFAGSQQTKATDNGRCPAIGYIRKKSRTDRLAPLR